MFGEKANRSLSAWFENVRLNAIPSHLSQAPRALALENIPRKGSWSLCSLGRGSHNTEVTLVHASNIGTQGSDKGCFL